jgi:hypothetical protein
MIKMKNYQPSIFGGWFFNAENSKKRLRL